MTEKVDVIVIGMGVGGETVAESLADEGLTVLGIEANLVGGECPYWGCIPSKMMIRSADLLAETQRVNQMAGTAKATPDWNLVATRIREEATTYWDDSAAVNRFTEKGGRFVRGKARLAGPQRVEVGNETFEANRGIVIGTGTTPVIPPIAGLKDTPYWTNREAIETPQVPRSLILLGGGAIGLELAQVFQRFGSHVTVVEAMDSLLSAEEPESSELARRALEADGVTVRVGSRAEHVSYDDVAFSVTTQHETLTAERLLIAVGRRADLSGLGLDTVGLDPRAAGITVDEHLRAGENLWAVGDVTGQGAFTHIATYQAEIVVADILGAGQRRADYRAVPRVTFTDPEIGAVGLTEARAREAGIKVDVALARIPETARGWIHQAGNDGFIKLIVDTDHGTLVGATAAGPAGGEMLGALSVAVHAQVPVTTLRNMIYAYPTFHRGILDALGQLTEGG